MSAHDVNDLITRLLHLAAVWVIAYVAGAILAFGAFILFGPRLLNWLDRRFDGAK